MNPGHKKPVRILFVDDELLTLRANKRLFRGFFEIALAESAEEALALLNAGDFQVVVSDYSMPSRDGLWLMKQIEASYPQVLRVLSTGSDVPALDQAVGSGLVQHCFSKPLIREKLIDCLKKEGLLEASD